EYRDESFQMVESIKPLAEVHETTLTRFALAWIMANKIVSSVIIGPRTMVQLDDNLQAIDVALTSEDEAAINLLMPPGEHTGKGYNDPQYPVRGRTV
ncbi:MAG: aldo/keto reductase, partial [Candidatus Latescibacteria bacterium]|nr:aldo/keto reductase [Candidatus Latescibacterota bacterium]